MRASRNFESFFLSFPISFEAKIWKIHQIEKISFGYIERGINILQYEGSLNLITSAILKKFFG